MRAFHVLATELNFTRAAARLHLSQQALSVQIRQLETRIGATLFTRSTRQVTLTDAGRALLVRVPDILDSVGEAIAETRDIQAGAQRNLVVGMGGVAGLDITPRILRAFAAEQPATLLTIRNMEFHDASAGLASGAADVALVWLPTVDGIETTALLTDERVAVLPADHPLTAQDSIQPAELAAEPFVWVEEMDATVRDYWTLADYRDGRPPLVGAKIAGFEDLFAAIRSERAVSASPNSVVRSFPWTGIATRPLAGLPPAVMAVARRNDDFRPAVTAFIDIAAAVAVELAGITPELETPPTEPQ